MRLRYLTFARPVACALASGAIVTGLVGAAQADPAPRAVQSAQRHAGRTDRVNRAPDYAAAVVDPARVGLFAAQRRLVVLESAAQRARQRYGRFIAQERSAQAVADSAARRAKAASVFAAAVHSELGMLAAAAYRSGPTLDPSTLMIVVGAADPQQYVSNIHIVRRLLANQESIVTQAEDAKRAAAGASAKADSYAAALRADEASVANAAAAAGHAAAVADAQAAAMTSELDALLAKGGGAQQAAKLDSRLLGLDANGGSFQADGSGSVQFKALDRLSSASLVVRRALAYALAQLGKPYVWGGVGPGSFDCSGLAIRAYGAAGVDLPHFAASQYQSSRPVSIRQLQPGDLLFWATDPRDSNTIYHEAIYLGGGAMVQSPKPGWNVMISNVWMWGPIAFVARPH